MPDPAPAEDPVGEPDEGSPPEGLAALGQAALLFRDELRLPFPPVPRGLAEATRILGPGLVGTRTDTPGPYGLDWFLDELRAGPVADYFLLGQAGHGVRSWYLHYYLVEGGLALFLQIARGGLGTDDASGAEWLELAFAQAARLLEREPGPLPPGERLVVVESDRSGRLLGRSRPGGGLALEPSTDPLAEAATLG